jgi:hypothetical protein
MHTVWAKCGASYMSKRTIHAVTTMLSAVRTTSGACIQSKGWHELQTVNHKSHLGAGPAASIESDD